MRKKRIGSEHAYHHDQSVSWMWNEYQTLNKPEIVKKVHTSHCCIHSCDIDLSSLTRPFNYVVLGILTCRMQV